MVPWWGTTLIGLASGILGGVIGGVLRERILHGQRRRLDNRVMRQEAPENLESHAEYVAEVWDGRPGPTPAGDAADRVSSIEALSDAVDKYRPVLEKDVWQALRKTVRDMRSGAHRGRPREVRAAAERALELVANLQQ